MTCNMMWRVLQRSRVYVVATKTILLESCNRTMRRAIRFIVGTCLAVLGVCRRSRLPLWIRRCNNKILFSDNFDAGELGRFSPSGNVDAVDFVDTPRRAGRYSARVSLDPATNRNHYRSEICPRSVRGFLEGRFPRIGQEYWYALGVFIPHNFVLDDDYPTMFAQWHGIPDRVFGEAYRNPPLALSIRGDNYVIESRADSKLVTPASGPDRYDFSHEFSFGSVVQDLGKWIDWVVHVRWSHKDNGLGFLTIWKDDVEVYARTGPNCFNDWRGGPYMKFGVYMWDLEFATREQLQNVRSRHLYFDTIRIGAIDVNCRDVAPWAHKVNPGPSTVGVPVQSGRQVPKSNTAPSLLPSV